LNCLFVLYYGLQEEERDQRDDDESDGFLGCS